MAKIRIEREDKKDLIINGFVLKVKSLYYIKEGESKYHAYFLKRITKNIETKEWELRLGGQTCNADLTSYYMIEVNPPEFRRCDCNFLCEGYVRKDWTWN